MDQLFAAIESRDIGQVLALFFELGADHVPVLRTGFRRENDAWDFKRGLPGLRAGNERAWADVAAHVAALHNRRGGALFFGIADHDFGFVGTRDVVDAKRFNDQIRRYLGDTVWVEFAREFIQSDQRYLGVALVPGRGLNPLRFRADAPADGTGARAFAQGDLAVREGDQRRILHGPEADRYLALNRLPSADARFQVNVDGARILRADYDEFIERQGLCRAVEDALQDDRTYVTSLVGVGGAGKTALACWAVLRAYQAKRFTHFVSVSAKDRDLSHRGIQAAEPSLGSFDDLLDQVLDVLGFEDYRAQPVEEKEVVVRELLPSTNALLFVDNLETVDDKRIIQFLESLPKPAKAITTSRIGLVKRAAYPLTVGPLSVEEAIAFLDLKARRRGREQLRHAKKAEKERIVRACSQLPLAIEWLVGQAGDLSVALSYADTMAGSKAKDEELLEFCFRRVHSALDAPARAVMGALALYDRPQMLEAVTAACGSAIEVVEAALSWLEDCSLVERVWDENIHDFAFRMLPITRRFAYRELQRTAGDEVRIRRRLSDWYEGNDVPDEHRALMVAARRGKRDPDLALVEAAIDFRKQGSLAEAEKYFRQAIDRNPQSWRAHREFAELLRDKESVGEALEHYEIAARHAPARGTDRALIYREWGMLMRQSGLPSALTQAAELFKTALRETPGDPIVQHALAGTYIRLSQFALAQNLLETLVSSQSPETRARSYPLLETCYEQRGDRLKFLELKDRIAADGEAAQATLRSRRTTDTSSRPLTRKANARPDNQGGARR